ncbi:MAG: magnesium/cobalt efflux protein [Gammaproteobacteria bacterium]|nr:MAG: magnesium/cobalt efflux protein [Gammaproteobacteria bacterium]
MSEVPLSVLFGVLVLLILLSAFFSGSETSMMALNRYRLKHLARHKHRGAQRASALLERPDRLIGLILLGNNFVNILASALATVIALRLMGEAGIAVAAGLLTLVILIFAEVAPKTLAALHPERVAFPVSYILGPLLKIMYPLVWVINWIANGLLRPFKVSPSKPSEELTAAELRTVVKEAGPLISRRHQNMLVSILDLEKVTVDAIMVQRKEINGIDLEDEETDILELLTNSQHTRLPLYCGDINDVVGILHLRTILAALRGEHFSKDALVSNARVPYFVPAGTPLHTQLFGFQRRKERVALIVDEYGEVEGLTTLEDILEEIVGEFTTDPAAQSPDIHALEDGSYLVDGSATIRDLNRAMNWDLPTDGPKTLNGLILEHMEAIPEPGTSLLLAGYPVEIIQTTGHSVKMAKVDPALRRQLAKPAGETD